MAKNPNVLFIGVLTGGATASADRGPAVAATNSDSGEAAAAHA